MANDDWIMNSTRCIIIHHPMSQKGILTSNINACEVYDPVSLYYLDVCRTLRNTKTYRYSYDGYSMKALGSDVSESEYRITGIHVRGLDCDETQQCESNMHEQQQKAEDIVLKEFAAHNFPLHKKGLLIP